MFEFYGIKRLIWAIDGEDIPIKSVLNFELKIVIFTACFHSQETIQCEGWEPQGHIYNTRLNQK